MKKKLFLTLLALLSISSSIFCQEIETDKTRIKNEINTYIKENISRVETTTEIDAYNQQLKNASSEELKNLNYEEIIQQLKESYLTREFFDLYPAKKEPLKGKPYPVCDGNDFKKYGGKFGPMYEGYSGTYTSGECDAIPSIGNPTNITFTQEFLDVNANHFAIITNSSDPEVPALNPTQMSNEAIRINAPSPCQPSKGINKLVKKIVLEQDGRQFITFDYAFITEYPLDHENKEPFFIARVVTENNEEFDRICIVSNPDKSVNPFFEEIDSPSGCTNAPVLWQDWTCGTIEVNGKKGEIVDLEFIVADCGKGAHFAYAYIDNICNKPCKGSNMGSIKFKHGKPCQTLPLKVNGSFIAPELDGQIGTLASLELEILQGGVPVGIPNPITTYTNSGNSFEFNLDTSNFPSPLTGGYDFRITAKFNLGGGIVTLTDTNTIPGLDNDFTEAGSASFGSGITSYGDIQIFGYSNPTATHEWYVLSSTTALGGPYTPVYSTQTNAAAPFTLIDNTYTQNGLFYTVIHKVISDCGISCYKTVLYCNTSQSRSASSSTNAIISGEAECCLTFEFWPNGPGQISEFTAEFQIGLSTSGVINTNVINTYSGNPDMTHEWHLYSSPNNTGGPYTLVDQQTGVNYNYSNTQDGLYYFLQHTVEGSCGKICYVRSISRNFSARSKKLASINGEIDCDYFTNICSAPQNVKYRCPDIKYTNPRITWDQAGSNTNYVIRITTKDPSCKCRRISGSLGRSYIYNVTGTQFTIPFNIQNECFSYQVGTKCKDGSIKYSSKRCKPLCLRAFKPITVISPNPSNGLADFIFDSKDAKLKSITITDISGFVKAQIPVKTYPKDKITINWDGRRVLKTGIYFAIFNTDIGINVTEKIIIK